MAAALASPRRRQRALRRTSIALGLLCVLLLSLYVYNKSPRRTSGLQGGTPLDPSMAASVTAAVAKRLLVAKPVQPTAKPIVVPALRPHTDADVSLTRQFIESHSQDGYIIATMANEHFLDFTLSWVAALKKAGVTGYAVGATDGGMLTALLDRGIPTWNMSLGLPGEDLGWGTPAFLKMSLAKIYVFQAFLKLAPSISLVLSDVDVMWLRNPIPFFKRFPEADLLVSHDMVTTTVSTEDLEVWREGAFGWHGHGFNVGIIMARPTAATLAFMDEWGVESSKPDAWDQSEFYKLLRRGHSYASTCTTRLCKVMNGTLTAGVLPISQFAGHAFFVQRKAEQLGLQPYAAHTIFLYSFVAGKRHRLREFMLFEDPPQYYDHPKGFITIRVDIPKALFDTADGQTVAGEMTVEKLTTHFMLINHQLLWIRAAIALAQLTGRVLIMPPLWCEIDRYWPGNQLVNGTITGVEFPRPYICPMDMIFEIDNGWRAGKPEETYGPHLEWREYSFLSNPRLPRAVNESRLVVEVCQLPGDGCADGSAPVKTKGGHVRLAPGLDSSQLSRALLPAASSYKIWDVTNIVVMWPPYQEKQGWFTDVAQHARFVNRITQMTAQACCLSTLPSWVWYDFQWDVPHTDMHGRRFEKWHMIPGDKELNSTATE